MGNHEWIINRNWQHMVDKDTRRRQAKQKNTTHHNMCLTPLYTSKHK